MDARLHKVELYILDPNSVFDTTEEVISYLECNTDIIIEFPNIKTAVFNWGDDLDINKSNATKKDFEKYFKGGK